MTTYEYITIFTSIILGLAMVHCLSGISLMLDKKVKTTSYWLHSVWLGSIFLVTVLVWWNNLPLKDMEGISFAHYLNLVAYAVVIFLMSGLLFPLSHTESVNLKEHFNLNKYRLYAFGMAFVLIDFTDAFMEKQLLHGEWRIPQLVNISIYFVFFALSILFKKKWLDAATGLIFLFGLLIWLAATFVEGFA